MNTVTSFGAESRRENTILCKLHMLHNGDRFIIPAFLVNRKLQVGDHYPEDSVKYAMVRRVIREEKPWWAFWRKPRVVAYEFVYWEEV